MGRGSVGWWGVAVLGNGFGSPSDADRREGRWHCSRAGQGGRLPCVGGSALWRPGLGHILVSEVLAAVGGGAAEAVVSTNAMAAHMVGGAEVGGAGGAQPVGGEDAAGVAGRELDGDHLETEEGGAEGGGVGDPLEGGGQLQAQAGCLEWWQLKNPGTLPGPTASAQSLPAPPDAESLSGPR